ncbi:MAG: hypothetical protein ABIF71_15730 [Planctomycetota bacterium]
MTAARPVASYCIGAVLCFIVAFHAVTITHELAGHGLAAVLAGQRITDVFISWLGGSGLVMWEGEPFAGWPGRMTEWAGILATLATGGVAWLVWMKYRHTGWPAVLLWITALCMFASGFWYMADGLHRGYGDMRTTAAALAPTGLLAPLVWAAMLLHGTVLYFLARRVIFIQARWLEIGSPAGHWVVALLILGGGGGLVGLANLAESRIRNDREHAALMKPEAVRLAEADMAREARERLRAGRPPLTAPERLAGTASRIRGHQPWPLIWAHLPILLLAAVMGTVQGIRFWPDRQLPVRPPVWLWCAAAGSIGLSGLISLL